MMFIIAATILGVVSAAPLGDLEILQRANAASYGSPYGSPCGGQPISLYLSPQPNPPPMYRETDFVGSARSYYDSGVGSASSGSASASTSSGSTVIGLFPDAKVDCALPLLLNCAPNVISGHLEKPKAPYPAYRTEEERNLERNDANLGKVLTENEEAASMFTALKSKEDSLKQFKPKKE